MNAKEKIAVNESRTIKHKPMTNENNRTAGDVLKEYQILTCDMTVAQVELMKLAMEEYRNQPTPPAKVEGVEQMAEALRSIIERSEEDYASEPMTFDFIIDTAKAALSSNPLPQAGKVEDAVGFAEWISHNIWERGSDGMWFLPMLEPNESVEYTTTELYQLYTQSLTNKL